MDMVTWTTESLVHSPESELPVAKPKIQDGSSLGGEQAQREGGRCDPHWDPLGNPTAHMETVGPEGCHTLRHL